MTPALELRRIRTRSNRSLSLSVAPGQRVGLVMAGTAGSDELSDAIAGRAWLDEGAVLIGGADVSVASETERARAGLVVLGSTPQVFSQLSVFENVMVATTLWPRLRRRLAEAHARRALARAGLAEQSQTLAGSLNLTDLRRLEIACVVAVPRRAVVVAQLSFGLDATTRRDLAELLASVTIEGAGLLWLDRVETPPLPVDRLLVIDRGAIVADGVPAGVLAGPEVRNLRVAGHW